MHKQDEFILTKFMINKFVTTLICNSKQSHCNRKQPHCKHSCRHKNYHTSK